MPSCACGEARKAIWQPACGGRHRRGYASGCAAREGRRCAGRRAQPPRRRGANPSADVPPTGPLPSLPGGTCLSLRRSPGQRCCCGQGGMGEGVRGGGGMPRGHAACAAKAVSHSSNKGCARLQVAWCGAAEYARGRSIQASKGRSRWAPEVGAPATHPANTPRITAPQRSRCSQGFRAGRGGSGAGWVQPQGHAGCPPSFVQTRQEG